MVRAQRGEIPEEVSAIALPAQRRCQRGGVLGVHAPLAPVGRDVLQPAEPRQDRCRRPGAPPGQTGIAIRGIAHERTRRWPQAEADLLKALELEPDQPFVLNYLGYSWVDQGLNLDRAKEMLHRAVDLRPEDGYIVDSLGWAYYRLGENDKAVTYLERAVELQPGDPVLNDHLGDVYWRVGRTREARFQWQRALTFEPESDQVPLIQKKLANGLADAQPAPG